MTINATTPAQSAPTPLNGTLGAGGSSTTTASKGLSNDNFLQLLVAQLKYQDPSKPVDTAEFMAQTAQLTQTQKVEEMTASMNELVASQSMLSGSSLVGREVTYAKADGSDATAKVTAVRFDPTQGTLLRIDTGDGKTYITLPSVKEVSAPAGG
jgi:flagellar basal-body rod modification protein FlgD